MLLQHLVAETNWATPSGVVLPPWKKKKQQQNLFWFKFGCNAQHQNMPKTASVVRVSSPLTWGVVLRMSLGVTVCLASVSGATEPLWSGGHCSTRGWAPPTLQAKVYGE